MSPVRKSGDHYHLWGDPDLLKLAYVKGRDPYVNLYDEADRPLPVFTAHLIGNPCRSTPFSSRMTVSPPLPYCPVQEASYPVKTFECCPCQFGDFYATPAHMDEVGGQKHLRCFRTAYECETDMDLLLSLGYDGPIKVFIDTHEVYMDTEGTNPIVPGQEKIPYHFSKGCHEILMIFDAMCSKAWGISLRLMNPSYSYDDEHKEISINELKKSCPLKSTDKYSVINNQTVMIAIYQRIHIVSPIWLS